MYSDWDFEDDGGLIEPWMLAGRATAPREAEKPAPVPRDDPEALVADLNKDLNSEQKRAAETTEGPVQAIAGAGAGKTKMLVHRVATLMTRGVPAANILVVTFTNRAAEEIKNRIEGMIGENGQYVHAGTFHSIIFRQILKMSLDSAYLAGLGIDPLELAIIDDKETTSLIKDAMADLDETDTALVTEEEWKPKDILAEMSRVRADGVDLFEYSVGFDNTDKNSEFKRVVRTVWGKYSELCRSLNAIDFDDILVVADKLLRREPERAREMSKVFRYIMLDEYQDTNPVQMSIMDSIAKHHGNICAVGDEKQSIYGFRGSDIQVILSFAKRYPNTKMIDMDKNYRSYPEVLRHCNALADAMGQRLNDGQLHSMRPVEEYASDVKGRRLNLASMVAFDTDADEADVVVRSIARDKATGTKGREIAILYRNRVIKSEIEKVLVSRDIPYQIVGDTSFYQRAEVKDFIALVKFLTNPWDSISGLRFVKAAPIKISDKAVKDAMKSSGINVYEYLRQQSTKTLKAKKGASENPTAVAKVAAPLIKLMELTKSSIHYQDPPEFIVDVISKIWDIYLLPPLAARCQKNGDHLESKIENIALVLRKIKDSLASGLSMDMVIEDLSMLTSVTNNEQQEDGVQLMTWHASKGLEFNNVYVIGVDEMVTHGDSEEPDPNDIEESRRTLYVAATRAQKKLAISCSKLRSQFGQTISTKPSPFLGEIESRTGTKILAYKPKKSIEAEAEIPSNS